MKKRQHADSRPGRSRNAVPRPHLACRSRQGHQGTRNLLNSGDASLLPDYSRAQVQPGTDLSRAESAICTRMSGCRAGWMFALRDSKMSRAKGCRPLVLTGDIFMKPSLPPSDVASGSRKYSEIAWLPMSRIASTSTNADRLTGLPNTYSGSTYGRCASMSIAVEALPADVPDNRPLSDRSPTGRCGARCHSPPPQLVQRQPSFDLRDKRSATKIRVRRPGFPATIGTARTGRGRAVVTGSYLVAGDTDPSGDFVLTGSCHCWWYRSAARRARFLAA